MTGRRRGPGRLFWIHTFAVGIASPSKGKRRIAAEMDDLRQKLESVQSENDYLREELAREVEKNRVHRARAENDPAARLGVPPAWAVTDSEVNMATEETPEAALLN